jgi:hypothetical protein
MPAKNDAPEPPSAKKKGGKKRANSEK